MKIIGIDPGSILCGYGVLNIDNKNSIKVVEYGTIAIKKKSEDINIRIKEVYNRIIEVISRNKPDVAAIETQFYQKNAQSLIKLTMARTAALLPLLQNSIPVFEYAPSVIKKSITGRGNAAKEQVAYMVQQSLHIASTQYFDTTDALAIALCHYYSNSNGLPQTKKLNWAEYYKQYPEKFLNLKLNEK